MKFEICGVRCDAATPTVLQTNAPRVVSVPVAQVHKDVRKKSYAGAVRDVLRQPPFPTLCFARRKFVRQTKVLERRIMASYEAATTPLECKGRTWLSTDMVIWHVYLDVNFFFSPPRNVLPSHGVPRIFLNTSVWTLGTLFMFACTGAYLFLEKKFAAPCERKLREVWKLSEIKTASQPSLKCVPRLLKVRPNQTFKAQIPNEEQTHELIFHTLK